MSWFYNSRGETPPSNTQRTSYILTDEKSFYHQFAQDLVKVKQEIIIESPYITLPRLRSLTSHFELLIRRGVALFIITRSPHEHTRYMSEQSEAGIRYFEALGVQVLLCQAHHRKIAIIDRNIVWKGSLNILSQGNSREFMEREENKDKTEELFKFLKYDQISCIKKRLIY